MMVGRDDERERLSTFMTDAGERALILRGETGIGKSALLDHAVGLAAPHHQVIRATGVEAEAELPYAGLHQLLYPLFPHLAGLDDRHRAVFDVVFGPGQGETPSVMSLGIAVLDLLALAATDRPLLLALDDGHWLDASSIEVCGFVGRRLAGGTVRMLVAVRSDVTSRFDTAALPELAVPALTDRDAEHLLDARHPALDARTRRAVLDQAGGNPLALLELPPHVGPGEEAPVPLSRRLQHVYGARVQRLDAAVRAELLLGALDGVAAGPGANRSYGARHRMRDVDEAAAADLLDTDPATGEIVFRHPLIRSTIVRLATPNQRRAAHAKLARVYHDDVERRAHHLAAAQVDPDEEVAAALEAAAGSATRRGGAVAAVAWLTRAAELSETAEDRSRRLGDAAFIAGHAALLDQARELVHSGPAPDGTASPAAVVTTAYAAMYEDGDLRSAHRQVTAVLEDPHADFGSGQTLTRLVNLMLAVSQYSGDATLWRRSQEVTAALGDRLDPRSAIYRDAWGDVVRHGAGVHERVERAFASPALEPWDLSRLAVAAYHVDILSRYSPRLRRAVDREIETGAMANGMTMLHLIMLDELATGRWDDAERTGQRVLELTTSHGYTLFAHHTRAYLGLLAALRGQVEHARELQAVVDAWARPRGVGFLTQIADAIGTTAALSEGDHEAAYMHAIGITAPGSFEPYAHQAPRTLLDLVEAAVHTGRVRQAREHAQAALDAGLPEVSPRLALVTYGALAMTANDDTEAERLYGKAESGSAETDFPFELARLRLAHGTRLRHARGPRTARPLLARAAETFDRLGATGWAERAHAELRAAGLAAPAYPTTLTWQERRIADLAAAGLTNKEIGERMHLSPRTVSSHLYRVFPKLGITSRAALRDALSRLGDTSQGKAVE
ncbi:AAA family ATPase [Streptosporangium saharense]|uniref:AAA family ATPase n=1 Tax=Streptosporangium saharense TaxID=1706840 RepID=UPI0036854B07